MLRKVFVIIPVVASLLLASCQPQVVESERVVVKEVPVEVIKEVVVEKEVRVEVEKEVEVIKEVKVEVEKIVEVAPEASLSSRTFTVAWTATDPPSLDPGVCNDSGCHTLTRAMYDSLLGFKYGTTELEGVLAESWEVSDDGLAYTFVIKDGVNFSDGSPVTAADVAYSFDRLDGIGKGPSFVISDNYAGSEVVDDKTVTVNLIKSVGAFPSMLPRVFIVNSKLVQEYVTDDDPWAEEWVYDHDAGSGPFVIESWEHGAQVALVKNDNYWVEGWPKIDRFVELLVPERATDQLLLEGGDVDTVLNPVLDILDVYEANPYITVSEHDSLIGMQIMMSQIVPIMDDVRVRKAISLAFDYPPMASGVYQGHAVQAQGPLAHSMPYHNDSLPMYQQDLEQAAELLAEAGYPGGGGIELDLLIVAGQPYGIGASQILQQGLAEIGVTLNVQELTWATLLGRIQSRENPAPMFTFYDFPGYPDPDSSLYLKYHTSQQEIGYNGTFWGDDETDTLLETARYSSDQAEREQIYMDFQQRLFDDHVAVWLVNPNWINVRRTWVTNYEYDPTWNQTFRPDQDILEGKP